MGFLVLLVAMALGSLGHPVAASVAAHTAPQAFCDSPGPKNYAAALSDLPPIHRIRPHSKEHPGLGNLSFGPRTIEMYVDVDGAAIVDPSRYGVAFWDVGFLGNKPKTYPRLDWLVTAQLVALDSAGASSEEVAHGHIRIAYLENADQPSLNLPVPDKTGFYRFDVQIAGPDGENLGSYSEYLRVVPPSAKVRLGISDRRFRPGQMLATRPEELGTDSISFGEEFTVQRRSSGRWRRYSLPKPEFWELWGGVAGPGGAGRCSYFRIPADARAGRYRIVKNVSLVTGGEYERRLVLTAPFSVLRPRHSVGPDD